jgi:hypothetical protein
VIAAYLIASAIVITELFRRNAVVLAPSHKFIGKWNERFLSYLQNFLFALFGAALSVILQAAYDRIKGK